MGLFSFFKNAGAKVFGKRAEAKSEAEVRSERIAALKSAVTGLGIEVQDFALDLDDDKVTAYGQVANRATKEKVILALGNNEGIATVDDRLSIVAAVEEVEEPEAVFYTVESGDSLSKIAKEQYGDAMKYPVIFEANQPMLKSPDLIYPGQVLRIPPLKA